MSWLGGNVLGSSKLPARENEPPLNGVVGQRGRASVKIDATVVIHRPGFSAVDHKIHRKHDYVGSRRQGQGYKHYGNEGRKGHPRRTKIHPLAPDSREWVPDAARRSSQAGQYGRPGFRKNRGTRNGRR